MAHVRWTNACEAVGTIRQVWAAGLSGGIWALAMLSNGQLVSGGGSGRLQFWDTRTGTLRQEFTEHNADVLTIAISPDGDSVFAAGIDERIAMFRRVSPAQGDWLPCDDCRMSGSQDMLLAVQR